jgi:hypothetical protein
MTPLRSHAPDRVRPERNPQAGTDIGIVTFVQWHYSVTKITDRAFREVLTFTLEEKWRSRGIAGIGALRGKGGKWLTVKRLTLHCCCGLWLLSLDWQRRKIQRHLLRYSDVTTAAWDPLFAPACRRNVSLLLHDCVVAVRSDPCDSTSAAFTNRVPDGSTNSSEPGRANSIDRPLLLPHTSSKSLRSGQVRCSQRYERLFPTED